MSYTFKTMTDEELNNLMSEGIYDFEVKTAMRKVSKSGNPMAELSLSVWDSNGKANNIRDWLVFSGVALNIRKVKHFCDTVGLIDAYQKGELPEELEGLSGKVSIGIDEGQMKPDGSMWPKKNVVVDYIKGNGEKKTDTSSLSKSTSVSDRDLPFDDIVPF